MKIVITGSHFTPAQAVIEELQKNLSIEIAYIGRKYTLEGDKSLSVESQILPQLGIKFYPVTAARLQRSFTIYTIPSLLKIPIGLLQSFYLLLKERPDAVLSFGGYVSVPVVISAWLLSIPVLTHEQTLVSGLANTINSYFADKVAISFPPSGLDYNPKLVLTGNPIRREILESNKNSYVQQIVMDGEVKKLVQLSGKEKMPLILITGGNQGSHVINQAVLGVLAELTQQSCVIHQTGDSKFKDYETLQGLQKTLKNQDRYLAMKWIEAKDLGVILKSADLVVSRGGVNTLLELAYLGKPVLIIPLSYLHKNEQIVNARYFHNLGLGEILSQQSLSSKNLLAKVKEMLKNINRLKERAKAAKNVVIVDAAKRLALETILLTVRKDR